MQIRNKRQAELSAARAGDREIVAVNRQIGVRRYVRADIQWPVLIDMVDVAFDAEIVNIGPDGAFITCPDPLRLSETFELIIKVPGVALPLAATATVVWTMRCNAEQQRARCGMGVRFERISEAGRELVNDAVSTQYLLYGQGGNSIS